MNKEMHQAIRLFNEHSLSVISTDRQIKNGTIMVQDDFLATRYTIHKTGYARIRVFGYGWGSPKSENSPGNENNHYQLNKVKQVTVPYSFKGLTYQRVCSQRILLPGDYVELAKMVIRKANRERLSTPELREI